MFSERRTPATASRGRPRRIDVREVLALAILALSAGAAGRTDWWLLAYYPLLGAIAFGVYGLDKARARAGEWRVSEATLHFIDLLGGIVGGLLGQLYFRHKTAKPGFAFATYGIAAVHMVTLLAATFGLFEPTMLLGWIGALR